MAEGVDNLKTSALKKSRNTVRRQPSSGGHFGSVRRYAVKKQDAVGEHDSIQVAFNLLGPSRSGTPHQQTSSELVRRSSSQLQIARLSKSLQKALASRDQLATKREDNTGKIAKSPELAAPEKQKERGRCVDASALI